MFELAILHTRRGRIALLSEDQVEARAALNDAQTLEDELGSGPDSALGKAIADLSAKLADF